MARTKAHDNVAHNDVVDDRPGHGVTASLPIADTKDLSIFRETAFSVSKSHRLKDPVPNYHDGNFQVAEPLDRCGELRGTSVPGPTTPACVSKYSP
jgi:hypothetical protein